ncbi:MAG: TIGR01177 family methyltransferase [Methanobrevibacter sp.]|jgi:tRNA (guanine10-N2)-dimethyltransferase|nr:TIGR01177 family methyltransferase [Candidatus Methanoflexus mossambicus]
MELIIIQSQEHPTLPMAELNAIMETEEINGRISSPTVGLALIEDLNKDNFDKNYKILVKRLAYAHEIDEIILKENIEENINSITNIEENNDNKKIIDENNSYLNVLISKFKEIDWNKYINNEFAVRIKKYDNKELDTIAIERKLGSVIKHSNPEFKVKLDNPKSLIHIIITKKAIFVGLEKYKINKKHFQNMKPHKRPFFYPGSMSPKLARAMVNLSKVKKGETILDPFCGTGGILIEGGMIGAKLIGSDINWKMKNGTGINLNYCNFDNWETHHLDVRELKLYDKVDSVVTDPPYGISTSTGGENSEKIFYQFLDSIAKNMKENALLVMASPHYLKFDDWLNDLGFKLVDRHEIKMHKSLTRIISVIAKIKEK